MVGVGGGPFQTVEDQLLEARHVFAMGLFACGDPDLLALVHQRLQVGGRLPGRRAVKPFRGLPNFRQASS